MSKVINPYRDNDHFVNANTLILIDTNSLIVRFGFADSESILPRFIKKIKYLSYLFQTSKILFVMDCCSENFRKKIYSEYKAHRSPLPDYIKKAIEQFKNTVESLNIPLDYHKQYECDDIIATYANLYTQTIIITTDKDLYQLVCDNQTYVFLPFRRQIIDEEAVMKKFKVCPKQIPLFLALVGDASDNIPGINQIGPIKAAKLIQSGCKTQNLMLRSDYDFSQLQTYLDLTQCYCQVPVRYNINQLPSLNINQLENKLLEFL